MIVAGICIVTAAVFLLRGDFNAAFVVAVVGLLSWFLNYRTQVSESRATEDLPHDNDQKGGDNSNQNQDSAI